MSQTQLIKELASLVLGSYTSKKSRPKFRKLLGVPLMYEIEKSNELYSHYENKDVIIVSIHGANTIELNLTSIIGFLAPNIISIETERFCGKYVELLNVKDKKVFLVGHSLGNFMIASCSLKHGKSLTSIMFAPYVPSEKSKVGHHLGTNPKFKKLFYKQDFFANNLIKISNQLKNTLLFSNGNIIANIKHRKNHAIKLFNQDINKDFVKRIG